MQSPLGQVYLGSQSFDSYLPEFVKQSDVFNKEVKNVLIKIADLQTSQSLPTLDRFPAFSSVNEEITFLRKLVDQKNIEIENSRNQISHLLSLRSGDSSLIQQLQQRIKLMDYQNQQSFEKHESEKEYLQERINRIEEQIEYFQSRKNERPLDSQDSNLENTRNDGKLGIDAYKINQLTLQLNDLRGMYNILMGENDQLKLELEMFRSRTQDTFNDNQKSQLENKLSFKQAETKHQKETIESLNQQITILKRNLDQGRGEKKQSVLYQKDVQYLNTQITHLRVQLEQLQKKETQTYEQKVKLEKEVYQLTNQMHSYLSLKGEIESRRFELELSQSQNTRLQSQLTILTSDNSQLLHSKQYFEEHFRRSDQQVQELMIKIQNNQKEIRSLNNAQDHVGILKQELNQIHQKYIDLNAREKDTSLKCQVSIKDNQNLRNLLNTERYQSSNYRQSVEKRLKDRQEAEDEVKSQNNSLRHYNDEIENKYQRVRRQLEFTQSRLAKFQQTLLQFQKAYKEVSMESQEMRGNIAELQELQNIFTKKEGKMTDLITSNFRLVKHREGIKISQSYRLEKRNNLLNQIIEILESQSIEMLESKQGFQSLQARIQGLSSENERNRMQISTLSFEKQHLFNELDSLLGKLKYVEGNLERQTKVIESQSQQLEQAKRIHKNISQQLSDEMQKRVWLQNQMNGAHGRDIQTIRAERSEVMYKIRGILDN